MHGQNCPSWAIYKIEGLTFALHCGTIALRRNGAFAKRGGNLKMKIKDPLSVRFMLADKGLSSHRRIAAGLKMSSRTVNKILQGESVNLSTIHKVAKFLEISVADIAEPIRE
jgi:DNA-binding Xre family transcriptional regulator